MDETLRFFIGLAVFLSAVIFEWVKSRSEETAGNPGD